MKTKNVVTIFCLIMMCGFSVSLQAQENLDALRKKCEKLGLLERLVIIENGKETINEKITVINDRKMVDELLDAFYADLCEIYPSTVSSVNLKRNQLTENSLLAFPYGTARYRINVTDGINAIINYIKKESDIDSGDKETNEKVQIITTANKHVKISEKERELATKAREAERELATKTREKDRAFRDYERELATKVREAERAFREKENMKDKKIMVPKGSYMIINGEKVTAEQARKLGYNVEEF